MRFLPPLAGLLLLNGCFFFGSGQASYSDSQIPDNLRRERIHAPEIPDHHPYGPVSGLKAGEWASYRVVEGAATGVVTLGVVRVEADGAWIEVVEEGDLRRASARLVDAKGIVRKALYREATRKAASPVVPQPVGQSDAEEAPVAAAVSGETEVEISGTKIKAVKMSGRYQDDAIGRVFVEETLWSPSAPGLYAANAHGGLLRRSGSRDGRVVELVKMGGGYEPVIPDPK